MSLKGKKRKPKEKKQSPKRIEQDPKRNRNEPKGKRKRAQRKEKVFKGQCGHSGRFFASFLDDSWDQYSSKNYFAVIELP